MEFVELVIYASIYTGLFATTFYILSFWSGQKKEKQLFKDSELPKVSILIPVYNEEKSIERTLKSILKSNYPKGKFEVIVIDDGSKDNTLKYAKKFESKIVRVFSAKHGGKGHALNFGIKKAKGEIIFSMDADTMVEPRSVKNMTKFFKNKDVMCSTPAMTVYKPKGILQKVQYIEYLTGLFLRKTFSYLNAIHVTPGAFSAYRRTFFDKHGGYDENNITEDLEMSLRIQHHGYTIENSNEAPAYTIAPNTFMGLLKQRRRWYAGLMKNTWRYRDIFSPRHGDLGLFVFPIALISIVFCVFITAYLFFKTLFRVKDELIFLNSINFDFSNLFNLNFYFLERMAFLFFTNPIVIFLFFFMIVIGFYLHYASKKLGNVTGVVSGFFLFFIFFALFFGFWWIVSIFYVLFNRKISWK
jgi:cellulose synthase/poly-beta-1,6-N-acetylglucosamine synthase-like glycosyltransferase